MRIFSPTVVIAGSMTGLVPGMGSHVSAMLQVGATGDADVANDIVRLNGDVVRIYGEGRQNEALAIAERALAMAEEHLGAVHPATLTAVNNLAAIYYALGRQPEALPLYVRALDGREQFSARSTGPLYSRSSSLPTSTTR